jgi:hypothetical protein
MVAMLGPVFVAGFLIMEREGLWWSEVLFERAFCCSVSWWARVLARRTEARWSARSSADGGSPKMKNFMKKKIRRAMESWPTRKPCVKERLRCEER